METILACLGYFWFCSPKMTEQPFFEYITWLTFTLHFGIGTVRTCFLVSAVVKLYKFFHQQATDKFNLACVWMRQWWTGISHSKDSVLPSTGLQSPTCSLWSGTVQSQNGSMGSFPGSKLEIHSYLLAPVSGRRWGKNAEGDSLVIAEDQDREIVSQHNLCFEYFSILCLGCMLIFSVCYHPVKM